MRKNSALWMVSIMGIFILVILNIAMLIRGIEYNEKLSAPNNNLSINNSVGKTETREECPDAEGGDKGSFLQVKYFYSKFCPWCIKEEPILQKLAKNYGGLIHIMWYNINNCPDLVEQYQVNGVPTFVFSTVGNQTEYSHYGFIAEEGIMELLCDVAGGC